MEVYKFKSLNLDDRKSLEHTLDIIQNNRLYCGTYDSMNDPFEGVLGFRSVTEQALKSGKVNVSAELLGHISDEWKDFKQQLSKSRFCSLTTAFSEVLMWSHYAGGCSGLAIKLDVPLEALTKVNYVKTPEGLPKFQDCQSKLTYKLCNWDYEEEYRLFHDSEYYQVEQPIEEIFISPLMDVEIYKAIENACREKGILLLPVRLDKSSGRITQ